MSASWITGYWPGDNWWKAAPVLPAWDDRYATVNYTFGAGVPLSMVNGVLTLGDTAWCDLGDDVIMIGEGVSNPTSTTLPPVTTPLPTTLPATTPGVTTLMPSTLAPTTGAPINTSTGGPFTPAPTTTPIPTTTTGVPTTTPIPTTLPPTTGAPTTSTAIPTTTPGTWVPGANNCNACNPALPDTVYFTFSGLTGSYAAYNGKQSRNWHSGCNWVDATFQGPWLHYSVGRWVVWLWFGGANNAQWRTGTGYSCDPFNPPYPWWQGYGAGAAQSGATVVISWK